MNNNFNKFPWSNMHGFNLDWVIETVKSFATKVEELAAQIVDIPNIYETIDNITNNRKLSRSGNFTGTWNGETHTTIKGGIDNNRTQIQYITQQFADGQTGLVIDGGFFGDDLINKNYDGGVW